MTLSDLERLAREAKASRRGALLTDEEEALIRACDPDTVLALLQLARAVQDWSKIRHRGATDDDRLYQALAALNLKDET